MQPDKRKRSLSGSSEGKKQMRKSTGKKDRAPSPSRQTLLPSEVEGQVSPLYDLDD